MLASGARRARPMSAKPASSGLSGGPAAVRGGAARPEWAPSDSEDEEDDGFIHDDEDEDEDEDDAFEHGEPRRDAFRAQLERVMAQPAAVAVARFRPASAPSARARPSSAMQEPLREKPAISGGDGANGSAASVSLSYLRLAAEKKKARDREFAVRRAPST